MVGRNATGRWRRMGPTPKGPRSGDATVRAIGSAPSSHGRATAEGYDPATGEVFGSRYTKPEHDLFALVERHGYTEDRFYCRSTDKQGHGEKLSVRIPQGIDSQIHAAVATVPEYNSVHDFFRDAAVHRLEYLQRRYTLSADAQRMLELERIQADAARADQEIEVMTQAVENIEARCRRAWEAEDYGMLADQMQKASETVDWLRDPYKAKATQILNGWRSRSRQAVAEYRARLEE